MSQAMNALKHGMSGHPMYKRWRGMLQRCKNPNHKDFQHYGGKGISVCERWMDFENFFLDMGDAPPRMTLDRIDRDGPYSPENCRWADQTTQMRNTKNTLLLEHGGKIQCAKDWAQELGINYGTLISRLGSGWPVEKALATHLFTTKGKPRGV